MTDRLDRIEAALETLATDFLRPVLRQAEANREAIAATDRRLDRACEVLAELSIKQDGIADAVAANTIAIGANERRFENLLNELRADRAEARQRFEAQERRFQAQQENIQNLLLELTRTNRRVSELEQRVS